MTAFADANRVRGGGARGARLTGAVHTKTAAVDLALRYLAGLPMTHEEALAMRGAHAIDEIPADVFPAPES